MQKESKKQLLIIDPKNEIAFKGPYNHLVTEYFTLKNPTESTIAFKVKTTAPKRYCVRPNNGQVAPHQTVQVAVMLHPGDLAQEKHKHKFMIQSVIVPNNNNTQINVDELFKSASPDEIMDSKFKCVFVDVSSQPTPPLHLVTTNATRQSNDDHSEAMSIDDLISNNAGNGSGGGMAEYSPTSSGLGGYVSTADSSNNYQNLEHETIGGSLSLNSASSTNGHHYETMDDYNNEANSRLRKKKMNASLKINSTSATNKHSDYVTSFSSTYENTNVSTSNQDKDVESKLKSAQEEIRMLKDKLQQVQRYASKFASSSSSASDSDKSSIIRNENLGGNGFLPNNHQLIQLSAMVVFISFIVGIFFGKTLF